MQILDGFRSHHVEMRDLISELELLLRPEQLRIPANARTAHQLLCNLSKVFQQHLKDEDHGLYPSLLSHEDLKIKSMAWGFISDERPLRLLFDDYLKRWLGECDFAFTDSFLSETREILAMVSARIAREESLLFPKLEEIDRLRGRLPPQRLGGAIG